MVVQMMYRICILFCWLELNVYNILVKLWILNDESWAKKCYRPIEVLRGIYFVKNRTDMPEMGKNHKFWVTFFMFDYKNVGFIGITSLITSLSCKIFGYADYVSWWAILIPFYAISIMTAIGVVRIYRWFSL